MGMFEAVIFAFLAFLAMVSGLSVLAARKNILEAVLGLCTSLFSLISAYNFRLALIDSGKNPDFLGFYRYPIVFPVYCIFVILGIALLVHGLIMAYRKRMDISA